MISNSFHRLYSLIFNGPNKSSSNDKIEISPDDIFLVSYPRSGNTWLRFILAYLLYEEADINFTNIHKYCPEMGKLQDFTVTKNTVRIIKSHEHFNPSFPKVIYVVRDGRDVYVSYYHYLYNESPEKISFKDFLDDDAMPYGRWSDHIVSWLDNYIGKPLLVIKYEDLFLNPISTIRKVLEFTHLEAEDKSIKIALEKASFNKMKESELKYGRGKYISGPNVFMRRGQIGEWLAYFGDKEKTIFRKRENHVLVRLQYEHDFNWL